MKEILITGAAGDVGKSLCDNLDLDLSPCPPPAEGGAHDVEFGFGLPPRQPAVVDQAQFEALELVLVPDPLYLRELDNERLLIWKR